MVPEALLFAAVLPIIVPAILLGGSSRVVALKIAAAVLLGMFPGWIYLQFIKNKGPSLYDEYVLNLFRLHVDEYANLPAPPEHTSYYALWKREHDKLGTTTKDNLYRRKFESLYGRSSVSTLRQFAGRPSLRDRTETFSPVLFATLLLCLGWILFLRPELSFNRTLLPVHISGLPALPALPLQLGFLGAYSFIVQDLIRRYFREDLRAAAYIASITRVVFVPLVILALHGVWPGSLNGEASFAFLIGFFPQVGLQALQAAVARPLGGLIPSIRSKYPLSELDGLNIWYEARLSEEGIEDMQNLVSASLVDLMLRSRAPIARLTDWIDQAYLCLHLPPAREDGAEKEAASGMRQGLRGLGIRAATELEAACRDLGDDPAFSSALDHALGVSAGQGPPIARSIIKAFEGENNLWHVRQFRKHEWLLKDQPLVGVSRIVDVSTVELPRQPALATNGGSAPTPVPESP
jgi:hypothetical protein